MDKHFINESKVNLNIKIVPLNDSVANIKTKLFEFLALVTGDKAVYFMDASIKLYACFFFNISLASNIN